MAACGRGGALVFGFFVAATLLGGTDALACTITWDGTGGNLFWQNRFNWSPDRLPISTDDVCIGADGVILSDFQFHRIKTLTTQGSLTISSSTVLDIAAGGTVGGTLTIQSSAQISNPVGVLTVNGLLINRNAALNGAGTTEARGGILAEGNLVDFWNQTVNNHGTATLSTSLTRIRMPGGTFNNLAGAMLKLQDGTGFDGLNVGSSAFNNLGTVVKEGTSDFSETTFGIKVNNAGTILSKKGRVRYNGAFVQTAGSTELQGGTMESLVAAPMDFQGGVLTGTGTFTGNVQVSGNNAAVAPGNGGVGMLQIVGTYAQSAGALNLEIGGTAAGLFDRLTVSGVATLGGTLNILAALNFTPQPNDTFHVMSFASFIQGFASVNAQGYQVQLNPTNVTLVASGAPPCAFVLNPAEQTVPGAGGTFAVELDTEDHCAWTASTNAQWITFFEKMGQGGTNLLFSVEENPGGDRTGSITVGDKTALVHQLKSPCTFSLLPESHVISSIGGLVGVQVTTQEGCQWTATETTDWVTITEGGAGEDDGIVTLSAAKNFSVARDATVTIAGKAFLLLQEGAPRFNCEEGDVPDVLLPPTAPLQPEIPGKFWQISYGELNVTFRVVDQGTHCEAQSSVGRLPIFWMDDSLNLAPDHFADSEAQATLQIFAPGAALVPQKCDFSKVPSQGINKDCLLNDPDPNAHYARWHTDGFTTILLKPEFLPDELNGELPLDHPWFIAGPYDFWVNLDAINASPANRSTAFVLRTAESYIHTTMVRNLTAIDGFAFIQDPGNINLLVIDRNGRTTGSLPDGRKTMGIPNSVYIDSETNPGILLLGQGSVGSFGIVISGKESGPYQLGIGSTYSAGEFGDFPVAVFDSIIVKGQSVGFSVTFDPDSLTQVFGSTPLVEGDLNADGIVNCGDVAVVRNSFGERAGSIGFNPWADRNADGIVNVRDLALISQRLPRGVRCQ